MKDKRETKYNLIAIIALSVIPIVGVLGTICYVFVNGVVWQEPFLLVIFWIITGLAITVGYHRLFSHRSFKAHPILEWILVFAGSAALENSILKWCSDHRRHHKHLDTDKDPYSITKGFFHAHIGWILFDKSEPINNVKDLDAKPAIRFQYKYYIPLFIVFSVFLPVTLGFLWGRPLGALFWGVFLRITLVHHFTYSINSICHYIGKRPYDYQSTSRDSWYASLITFGEGYHNYHHKFQWDYRNGIRWFNFDPSKWFIWILSKVGLARELKRVDQYQIMKAKVSNFMNQINEILDSLPNQIKHSYHEKLNIINIKIQNFEKYHRSAEEEVIRYLSDKKLNVLSRKIIHNKRKLRNIEYHAIIKTLSVMLFSIQTKQF